MRRQGVIENVPQCVHVDFFIHQSRVRRVHFFRGTPPRFVQSTGKWTSFIRARIVVQEFGNVKVINFGTSTGKQGNVAWIEIVVRHVHLLFIIIIIIIVIIVVVVVFIRRAPSVNVGQSQGNTGRQSQFHFVGTDRVFLSAHATIEFFQILNARIRKVRQLQKVQQIV